jgi:hypothetical protein
MSQPTDPQEPSPGTSPPSPPDQPSPPSPPPSPSPQAPGSSRASSAASSLVGDPGPAFVAGEGDGLQGEPADAPTLHALPELPPEWEVDTLRQILTAKGSLIHSIAGVGEQDWHYTEADLQAIAPPLARILNRYPVTRAAAGTGDEIALTIGLGGYVSRSYRERRAVLAAEAEQEPVPITGQPAPPGTGPGDQEPNIHPTGGAEWITTDTL